MSDSESESGCCECEENAEYTCTYCERWYCSDCSCLHLKTVRDVNGLNVMQHREAHVCKKYIEQLAATEPGRSAKLLVKFNHERRCSL